MKEINFGIEYLKELEAEAGATRKCLERVPEKLYDWKPHDRSMAMGYLVHLIAAMPKWITHMVEKSEIDLGTFERFQAKNTDELVRYFDENIKGAKNILQRATNKDLEGLFYLKNSGQVIFSSPIGENISSTINHMVHHRGQLTVYLRLNDLPVPSIYGPSADDKAF